MNVEFEKRMKIQHDTHINELVVENMKLNKTIEEIKASTFTEESIKAQVLELSEEFVIGKNELLDILNNIWAKREEQLRLQDKLVEIQGRYQEAHEALENMLSWQDMCKTPPTTFSVHSDREIL